MCPVLVRLPVDFPAVLADMQMPAIPAIRRNVSRHVPAAAAEVADEDAAPRQLTDQRGETAGEDVLLMTMNDICLADFAHQRERHRICPLVAHVPGIADDANP